MRENINLTVKRLLQEGLMDGDPNRIEIVFSDWNGGWRYGFQEYGAMSAYEWSKPFPSRDEAEREGKIALDRERIKRGSRARESFNKMALSRIQEDSYESAKIERDRLETEYRDASNDLKAIVNHGSGAFGLTPDAVKATSEWQNAKRRVDAAFQRLRDFNANFVSIFAKEIKADRRQ